MAVVWPEGLFVAGAPMRPALCFHRPEDFPMIHPLSPPARAALAACALMMAATAAHAQTVARDTPNAPLRAPTASEAAALAPTTKSTRAQRIGMITGKVNPGPITHKDGTVEQELDASTMSYTVARMNPDGTISMVCVTGEESANKAVKGGKSTRAQVATAKEHQHGAK
jgi:hypothetical protein